MKKISFIIILFTLLSIYSCMDSDTFDISVGQVYFYTPNDTTELYLFSQGVDFGSVTVLDDFNENTSIDSLLTVDLPTLTGDNSTQIYEFVVKKVDVANPVVEGNVIINGQNISIETITGTFEIDTTFTEFDLPNVIIKVDE